MYKKEIRPKSISIGKRQNDKKKKKNVNLFLWYSRFFYFRARAQYNNTVKSVRVVIFLCWYEKRTFFFLEFTTFKEKWGKKTTKKNNNNNTNRLKVHNTVFSERSD